MLNNIEIQIFNDSLIYKTLFRATELYWKEIIDCDLSFEVNAHSIDKKWIISAPSKSIIISSSYFSKQDNRFLAEVIVAKCNAAKISKSIFNLSQGKSSLRIFKKK